MRRILKGFFFGAVFQALALNVSACPECRAQVRGGVYGQDFFFNLLALTLPVVIVVAAGVGLYFAREIKARVREQVGRWQTKEPAVR